MSEKEDFSGDVSYEDALDLLGENNVPISRGDLEILISHVKDWYEDFNNLCDRLIEKYDKNIVRTKKLYHILSGSSQPISRWENLENDTPGGEMGIFAQLIIDKYKPQEKIKPEKAA